MSHNTSALAPYITEHTTALSTAGAGQSLVIKGFGLGLSTVVDIPAALGVETARAFTKTGATAGVLTITLTVEAIPDPGVDRNVLISMGGVPCQGPYVTGGAIVVRHGWTPEVLVKSASDGWFNPRGMAKNSASTGYKPVNGDVIVEWRVNGTTSGLSKLLQSDAARQPVFIAAHPDWDSSTNRPGIGPTAAGIQSWLNNANDGTWDRLDADDYTIAMAHTTFNIADGNGNIASGRSHIRWTNGERPPSSGYTDYILSLIHI